MVVVLPNRRNMRCWRRKVSGPSGTRPGTSSSSKGPMPRSELRIGSEWVAVMDFMVSPMGCVLVGRGIGGRWSGAMAGELVGNAVIGPGLGHLVLAAELAAGGEV